MEELQKVAIFGNCDRGGSNIMQEHSSVNRNFS